MVRLLLVLLLVGACAPHYAPHPRPLAGRQSPLGFTECTAHGPLAWVRTDVLASEQSVGVLAHEEMHGEQVRRFPDCRAFFVWFVVNTADAEAEAFCAGARAETTPAELPHAIARYAAWLQRGYPDLKLSYADAHARITRFCS